MSDYESDDEEFLNKTFGVEGDEEFEDEEEEDAEDNEEEEEYEDEAKFDEEYKEEKYYQSEFQVPVISSQTFQGTGATPPTFQPPTFQPPSFQPPSFQPPTFQPPSFQPPSFQSSTLQVPVITPPRTTSATPPTFQNLSFQAPVLQPPTLPLSNLGSNYNYSPNDSPGVSPVPVNRIVESININPISPLPSSVDYRTLIKISPGESQEEFKLRSFIADEIANYPYDNLNIESGGKIIFQLSQMLTNRVYKNSKYSDNYEYLLDLIVDYNPILQAYFE